MQNVLNSASNFDAPYAYEVHGRRVVAARSEGG